MIKDLLAKNTAFVENEIAENLLADIAKVARFM
jgi:hypothetical protein